MCVWTSFLIFIFNFVGAFLCVTEYGSVIVCLYVPFLWFVLMFILCFWLCFVVMVLGMTLFFVFKFIDVLVFRMLFDFVVVFELLCVLLRALLIPHTRVCGLSRGGCINVLVFKVFL